MTPSNPAEESNPADGLAIRTLRRSLNCDGAYGLGLGVACAALVGTGFWGDATQRLLRYQRDALAGGQWWRLVTAHITHLGVEHAVLNALGLVLLWMLFARDYSPRAWLLIVASSVAAIDLGLWMGDSTVLWYVGSSGALHGVLAAGALAHLRRREPDGWLLGALLVGKLAYEQFVGALPFLTGAVVVVDAHLYGALGGLLAATVLGLRAEPV